MIRKLLKYDILSLYKVICFISVAPIIASVVGGFALRYLNSTDFETVYSSDTAAFAENVASFTYFISILAIIAAMVSMTIFIFARFYKNLYTDEGYLTFTLPASHRDILVSKTINAVIWTCYQILLSLICICIYTLICGNLGDALSGMWKLVAWCFETVGAWMVVYIILGALAALGGILFSVCLIQFCITTGALFAKKAKLIAGIATYYAVNTLLGFIMQSFLLAFIIGGLEPFLSFVFDQSQTIRCIVYMLIVLAVLLVAWGLAACAHFATKRLVDRRLNLA